MKKFSLLLVILLTITLFGQERSSNSLLIGTKISNPFCIKTADGSWSGISFELWQNISDKLHYEYTIKEYDLEGLLQALEDGEIDVAVSSLSVTSERQKTIDFTQPYFVTGLSIATHYQTRQNIFSVFLNFFSFEFLEVIVSLGILLFIVGILIWFFERRKNAEQFSPEAKSGLGSGFWWAAVTMTTVGYGDKAPVSFGGRIIGLIWMFAGIIMISSFTASMTTALTVSQLDSQIKNIHDLYDVRVGTVSSSYSEAFLEKKGIPGIGYTTLEEAFDALKQRKLDAVIYDTPMLRYLIHKGNLSESIKTIAIDSEPNYFAFALPLHSPLRIEMNSTIMQEISKEEWKQLLKNYLGN